MIALHAALIALLVGLVLYVAGLVLDHVAGEWWWGE